jgi:glycosyltransferase involved in cell wall biosynthesis
LNSEKKITIITPSLNQSQYLEQTIESVLSQGYKNLEYIIIDGGSTDDSVSIIKKHEKYIAYWISERDNGQSQAINKGLKLVTGDIFNWLNSDDYLEPGALITINDAFSASSTNIVIGRSNIMQNGVRQRVSQGTDVYAGNLSKTLGLARIDQPETYFRWRAFESLGVLNEKFHYVMDKEIWMRYLIRYGLVGIKKIPDVIANFRWHETSKTISQRNHFVEESAILMHQFAMTNQCYKQAEVLENEFLKKRKTAELPTDARLLVPTPIAEQALAYFLLHKADEAYYHDSHDACSRLLSSISPDVFPREDKQWLRKLSFRSRYVPSWLIKWFRRWT